MKEELETQKEIFVNKFQREFEIHPRDLEVMADWFLKEEKILLDKHYQEAKQDQLLDILDFMRDKQWRGTGEKMVEDYIDYFKED